MYWNQRNSASCAITDRTAAEQHLRQVEGHVASGEEHIARQPVIIEKFKAYPLRGTVRTRPPRSSPSRPQDIGRPPGDGVGDYSLNQVVKSASGARSVIRLLGTASGSA
jgi:hypothetical protein